MDEQRLYPLVVWTPNDPLLPLRLDTGAAAPAADPQDSARTPSAAPDHSVLVPDLPEAPGPASPCPACPWTRECFELRQQAGYWKAQFERCKEREARLRQQLAEGQQANWPHRYEQSQEQVGKLQQQVADLQAKIHVLEKQLRGRKSEKWKAAAASSHPSSTGRKRGRQPNQPTPPRRTFDHLITQDEAWPLPADQQHCPHCGEPYALFPGTDDGDLIEIDVQAYRRRYHRHRYRKTCSCPGIPAVLTASPPPKLIPKGYLGISVWVLLLLEKYLAYQPTYRCLALLRSFDLDLPLGTITDGLHKLLPLFEPLYHSLGEHQRQEHHWHIDETRWLVFITQAGKVGYHWNLWVFGSADAVVFVLDPHRAHDVPEKHLTGATGIASVDRASNHKAMDQVKTGQIVLAFCWAHVRRDFLELLTGYTQLTDWAVSWLEEIRELYARNEARLEYYGEPTAVVSEPSSPPAIISEPPSPTVVSEHPPPAVIREPLPSVGTGPAPSAASAREGQAGGGDPQAFAAHDRLLREQVAHMAQRCDREWQQPDLHPACKKVLTSLQNHWSGLTVFVDHPDVPLDNNAAERAERGPVVARKNYYGSGALWSGRLAAMLFSLLHTLSLWNLCPRRWLTAYLTACAEAGGKVPVQATAFLPWNLTAEQKPQWALPSSQKPAPTTANTS